MRLRWIALITWAIAGAWVSPARAQGTGFHAALDRLSAAAGAPVRLRLSPATGLATFITADPARPIPLSIPLVASAEHRARAFLAIGGAAVGIASPDDAAALGSDGPDDLGMEHVRLQQLHRGIPVRGGEIVIHLRGASVVAVNARTLGNLSGVDTTAAVDAADAARAVRAQLATDPRLAVATLDAPRLEVLDPGHFNGRPTGAHLAWAFEARGVALRERIWVDAQTGGIIQHYSQVTDARDRRVYDAENTANLPGTLVRSEG